MIFSLLLSESSKINRNVQRHFNRRPLYQRSHLWKRQATCSLLILSNAILVQVTITPATKISSPYQMPQTPPSQKTQPLCSSILKSPATSHLAQLCFSLARALIQFKISPLFKVLQGDGPRSSLDILPPRSPICLHPLSTDFPPSFRTVGAGAASFFSPGPAA